MRFPIIFSIAFFCALFSSVFYSKATIADERQISPEHQVLLAAASDAIIPAHETLLEQISLLSKFLKDFCDSPDSSQFNQARLSWQSAMAAWSALAPIGFGPLDQTNTAWRFQFWPDPLNLVHRKFKARIKGRNKKISPEELAKASVAIQGLSALEYLLFDPKVSQLELYLNKPHLCMILLGTSQNLSNNAMQLTTLWREYPKRWISQEVEKTKPGYFKRNVEDLFSGVVMAVNAIRVHKLGAPLGYKKAKAGDMEKGPPNPWAVESWRSHTSFQQIQETLEFCQKLYTMPAGLGWYLTQQSTEFKALDLKIRQQFEHVIKQAASLLHDKNANKDSLFSRIEIGNVVALEKFYFDMDALHSMLKFEYTNAANITFRFNAHDGD